MGGSGLSSWEDAYKTTPPWDIGRPQPAFVELVHAGELTKGLVLDIGCGTGENALYLAENGFSVVGIDLSNRAIAAAKEKAIERKLKVNFRIANALSLDFKNGYFDNAIDSGLFHGELPRKKSKQRSPHFSTSTTFGTPISLLESIITVGEPI